MGPPKPLSCNQKFYPTQEFPGNCFVQLCGLTFSQDVELGWNSHEKSINNYILACHFLQHGMSSCDVKKKKTDCQTRHCCHSLNKHKPLPVALLHGHSLVVDRGQTCPLLFFLPQGINYVYKIHLNVALLENVGQITVSISLFKNLGLILLRKMWGGRFTNLKPGHTKIRVSCVQYLPNHATSK